MEEPKIIPETQEEITKKKKIIQEVYKLARELKIHKTWLIHPIVVFATGKGKQEHIETCEGLRVLPSVNWQRIIPDNSIAKNIIINSQAFIREN